MNLNQESNVFLKEKVIQEEIVNKNYNKAEFIAFLADKRPNGDDIQQWSIAELNDLILEFCSIYEKSEVDEYSMHNNKSKKNKDKENNTKAKDIISIDVDKIKIVSQDEIKEVNEIKCKQLDHTVLNGKSFNVHLRDPKANESNFFEANYITYEVSTDTDAFNWVVRRRYSDFEWLRAMLIKFFPRIYVSPLPKKKIGWGRFELEFIKRRISFLQKFINEILENESFKTTEALVTFLSMTDRSQFEAKIKELNTYQPSHYVEEAKTLTGKLTISNSVKEERYYANLISYFDVQSKILTRMNSNLKKYGKNVSLACEALEDVEKDFEALYQLNDCVLMKEEITKTYQELGIFAKNWKRIMIKQNSTIKHHIKTFFKFVKMEGIAFAEFIESRNEIKSKYTSELNKLNAKKEKLWLGKEVNKWEIIEDSKTNLIDKSILLINKEYAMKKMCTRETESIEALRKQLGYANVALTEEINNFIGINDLKFEANIKSFSINFYPTLTDAINVWSGLTTYLNRV